MANPAPITLEQLFRFKKPGLPYQDAAIVELEADLRANGYETAMRRDRPWFSTWSQSGKQDAPAPAAPKGSSSVVQLPVAYEAQNDNASGTGYRECFSSSCAMIARYWGKVRSDDEYNKIRSQFGDTIDPNAQVKALQSLGLKAEFTQRAVPSTLQQELNAGRPVAVGWLHHGTPFAPTGGGHWTVVIGYTADAFIHNDPNGEADLVNGGYPNHQGGAGVVYSRRNWLPRWNPKGQDGWAVTVSL